MTKETQEILRHQRKVLANQIYVEQKAHVKTKLWLAGTNAAWLLITMLLIISDNY
jgi:hypothetical protein